MQKRSKHSWGGALVLFIALWWAAPLPVNAIPFNPAVEYASETDFGGIIGTVGYQFSMSVPFTVDALASWDLTHVGIPNSDVQIGLWDSGGNPLVSTTVLGNTDPIVDHFQYHSITPMTLDPGAYTIGGNCSPFPCRNTFPFVAGVVTVPGYTWTTSVWDGSASAGLNYPTFTGFGNVVGQNGFLIPNFSVVSGAPVPEPSTILLLASGLAGIFGYGWRRKRQRKLTAKRHTGGGSSTGAAVFV